MTSSTSSAQISIAMATYNGEKFIQEQLDSIARQDLLPLELVVTDDGSTDATLQIVDEFARAAPFPVRVFCNGARLGYADNFLKAASLCRGDQIAFCDQDDIWIENKLSVCSVWFCDPRVSLVIHSARTITSSGGEGPRYPNYSSTKIFSPNTCDPMANMPGFAMVVAKHLLHLSDNTQRHPRFYGHDHWCWFLASCTGRIATIAEALSFYRQHDKNVFGAPGPHSLSQRAKVFARTLDYSKAAELELDCARILREAARRDPAYSGRLEISADRFELRSKLHLIRNRIYEDESRPFRRAKAFAQIMFLAGYLPGRSKTRLGVRDAVKDLILGVFRGQRFLKAGTGSQSAE